MSKQLLTKKITLVLIILFSWPLTGAALLIKEPVAIAEDALLEEVYSDNLNEVFTLLIQVKQALKLKKYDDARHDLVRALSLQISARLSVAIHNDITLCLGELNLFFHTLPSALQWFQKSDRDIALFYLWMLSIDKSLYERKMRERRTSLSDTLLQHLEDFRSIPATSSEHSPAYLTVFLKFLSTAQSCGARFFEQYRPVNPNAYIFLFEIMHWQLNRAKRNQLAEVSDFGDTNINYDSQSLNIIAKSVFKRIPEIRMRFFHYSTMQPTLKSLNFSLAKAHAYTALIDPSKLEERCRKFTYEEYGRYANFYQKLIFPAVIVAEIQYLEGNFPAALHSYTLIEATKNFFPELVSLVLIRMGQCKRLLNNSNEARNNFCKAYYYALYMNVETYLQDWAALNLYELISSLSLKQLPVPSSFSQQYPKKNACWDSYIRHDLKIMTQKQKLNALKKYYFAMACMLSKDKSLQLTCFTQLLGLQTYKKKKIESKDFFLTNLPK